MGCDPTKMGCDSTKMGCDPTKMGYDPTKMGYDSTKMGCDPTKMGYDSTKMGCGPTKLRCDPTKMGYDPGKLRSDGRTLESQGSTVDAGKDSAAASGIRRCILQKHRQECLCHIPVWHRHSCLCWSGAGPLSRSNAAASRRVPVRIGTKNGMLHRKRASARIRTYVGAIRFTSRSQQTI